MIRSRWGTSNWVFNPRNPTGRALIALTLFFVASGLLWFLR